YTADLWAYEGITSYYDDLMLLRAKIIDAPAYLDLLAENATRLQRTPGRLRQSLADASHEAWIKYYQPDENSPNQNVSYYIKGALAAMC
ncbi:M61 family peptidase, partial [Staphylococcus aureus]